MLSKDVAALFELTEGKIPKRAHFGLHFGTVDFSTLTVAEAEKLVAEGFPFLRRRLTVATKSSAPVSLTTPPLVVPVLTDSPVPKTAE